MLSRFLGSLETHKEWIRDVEAYNERVTGEEGKKVHYPIIADPQRDIAVRFGYVYFNLIEIVNGGVGWGGEFLPTGRKRLSDPGGVGIWPPWA